MLCPPPTAVVFDLDGTLVDSRDDLAAAVAVVRRRLGLAPLAVAEVVARVGHGARRLVRSCLPAEVAGDRFEEAYRLFLDAYYEGCVVATRPYPGVPALLAGLALRLPLGVLTNKPQRHTMKILGRLGIEGCFRAVVGGDALPVRKPDPAALAAAAGRLGTTPERTLLVGDSEVDAATAAAAGAPFVLVGWGYGAAEELGSVATVARADTVGELAAILTEPWPGSPATCPAAPRAGPDG